MGDFRILMGINILTVQCFVHAYCSVKKTG